MKNFLPILCTILSMLLSCQLLANNEEVKLPMITNTPSSPEIIGTYFKTMYQVSSGKRDDAQKNFKQLRAASSAPVAINRGYTHFLRNTKQYKKILDEVATLDKHFANDPNIQIAIVEALELTNQQQKAVERLLKLSAKFPEHQEIALHTAQAYLNKHDNQNALKAIDTFFDNAPQKPNNFMFHFFKAQILLNQNQKEKALESLKQCLATYRHFEKGWLLYALLEEQMGNLEEAIKGYTTFLDIAGNDTSVQNHLLELLFKQKMIKDHKGSISVSIPCLQKAILLFEQNQPNAALKQIEECLKQEPNNNEARLLKVQIHESLGQLQLAIQELTEWMLTQPENELWFKTAALLHKKGLKRHNLVEAIQKVEQKYPKAPLPIQYLADIYLRANNQQQALVYLQKVIELTNDSLLKARAYYQRARIYYQQHNRLAMAKELEAGYAANHDFAPLCNMLAYHYAGKGNNRVKALELVRHALKLEPQNPHFLDTLGYISYKQGELDNARKIIEPLASRVPHDTVIENHVRKINTALAHHALSQGTQN